MNKKQGVEGLIPFWGFTYKWFVTQRINYEKMSSEIPIKNQIIIRLLNSYAHYILLKLFENLRFLTTSYIISLRERAYQKFDKND